MHKGPVNPSMPAHDTGGSTVGAGAVPVTKGTGILDISLLATGTPDGTKFVRDDGTLQAAGGGSGTVTNTGGNLTANALVLGAGTVDTKVAAGITSDGTSKVNLGVAGASVGGVVFANATSGSVTVQTVAGALGSQTISWPAATGTVVLESRTISTTAPLSGGGDLSANRTLTTSMATNKLIGRGTAGTGVMEEMTLGTGLLISGTTIKGASAGSGTPSGGGYSGGFYVDESASRAYFWTSSVWLRLRTFSDRDIGYYNNIGGVTSDDPNLETGDLAYVHTVEVDSTSGARQITLPSAGDYPGRKILILDCGGAAGANNITIVSGSTITGDATIAANFGYREYIATETAGAGWFLINRE